MEGMDKSAARPRWINLDEQPVTVPMAPRELRRNPSTDQKRQRREIARQQRQRTATVLQKRTEELLPGDSLRMPTGQTVTVNRRRNHESSSQHYYLDTDQGTIFAHRRDSFDVVPHNSTQQSLPGMGNPGGNSNSMPWAGNGPGASGGNGAGSTQCPNCHQRGTLRQSGDAYRCGHCGYTQSFGGPSGHNLTNGRPVMMSSLNTRSPYFTADRPLSAVARRATEFISKETQ